ncbi:ATP-binding protein [Mesorhizobium captivum]|uniref:ATP-binding protein n=1 Tax=Mesorhizobium captivum TaxID=3072319 RepID=UPI002A23CA4E|nr:ATP-binding protein [Mesorhizobium sp. VK22E]MDX8508600.1 ATP-binding protein [Mesorhizobium sp. VK22E]
MDHFIGRGRELRLLERELDKRSASLVIAYGRRRIGKSRLLRQAAVGRNEIYFQATRVSTVLNMEQFKLEVARVLGPSPVLASLDSWEGIFHFVAEAAKAKPGTVVTIDEFPYLVDQDSALPSVIQRFWDSGAARAGNLKIILCGSAVAQMEDLLAEKNPLYGRMTLRLEVRQLPLRDLSGFFPEYSAEQLIETYAIFGGVPYYLTLSDQHASLRENVINLLLTETGTLIDEPNTLLQSELREPGIYASIVAAISEGLHSAGEIATRLQMPTTAVGQYIDRLERLHLVSSVRSLDAVEKSRNKRVVLTDRLMGFWHRFVRPNLTAINGGYGAETYDQYIQRRFPEYMGGAFEGICLDHARLHLAEVLGSLAREVGSIWGHADFDIDVAGRLLDETFFYGECKWRSVKIDMGMLDLLKKRSETTSYGRDKPGKQYLLFSRNGCKPELAELARTDASVHIIGPEELTFAPTPDPVDRPTGSIGP